MAFPDQIARADTHRRRRAPADGDLHTRGEHLLNLFDAPRDRAIQAVEQADARRMVARLANRHDCSGVCDAPEHTRDAAAALAVLGVLGLRAGGAP